MEFYNQTVKERYLNSIENEDSRNTVKYTFQYSKNTEIIHEKDLYNFSMNEITEVMKNAPSTENTLKLTLSNMRAYLSWCIKNGYRSDNINPLTTVPNSWAEEFVDRVKKTHFSFDEIQTIIDNLRNEREKAIVQCWFEGVGGKQFSELINLTYNDIDWTNNTLRLTNENGEIREIKVSELCLQRIQEAHDQTVYKMLNRVGNERPIDLIHSDHVFRPTATKRSTGDSLGVSAIYAVILQIKEDQSLDIFSYNSIRQSGQIYEAYQVYDKKGKIVGEDLDAIGEKYQAAKNSFGSPNRNLMKRYINSKNLKELYNVDVEI
ncbi:site-specific integrase [Cytobacillus gottheilii]|uniref:site-specific integrase n=1 Tax=Cytobacillus gottheilii TaxID=859144 RepID=UPI0009BA3DC3|nr:site-specific integrase [Cytobacillus gottheilii]